jgi:hypothetical protein
MSKQGPGSTAAITIPTSNLKLISGGSGLEYSTSPASLNTYTSTSQPDGILLSQITSVEQLSQSFSKIESISMASKDHHTKNMNDVEGAVQSKLKTDAKNYVLRNGGTTNDVTGLTTEDNGQSTTTTTVTDVETNSDNMTGTSLPPALVEELRRIPTEESNFNKNFNEKDYGSKFVLNNVNTSPTSNETYGYPTSWNKNFNDTTVTPENSDYMTLDNKHLTKGVDEFVVRHTATTITTTAAIVETKSTATPSVSIPPSNTLSSSPTRGSSKLYFQKHTTVTTPSWKNVCDQYNSTTPASTNECCNVNSATYICAVPLKHKHPTGDTCQSLDNHSPTNSKDYLNCIDDHLMKTNNTTGCHSCFHPTCAQFASLHQCHQHSDVYKSQQNHQTYNSELVSCF